jgi:amino acid transporter/nucleotide-binding universal stress UspA family protein
VSKELERDLGLYATITISMGAMIGSGIFVLPGLAAAIAGPAVILAYLVAGIVVFPAALAKSEMATAMPESGGTYLFIDRAMGPLMGTIAGLGAWFSLVFKSAFALVGLGAYLLVIVALPSGTVKIVALGLALVLILVNIVGVEQTGWLQATIVTIVVGALGLFIAGGLVNVNAPQYHPFFPQGFGGLLAATGFIFVSYAGVTKIASVAEEVENPSRNIPVGILGSITIMLLIYTAVTYVIVGVTPLSAINHSYIPMAVAAAQFLGPAGKVAIAAIAVIALTSMANAGILSSSRYPLAMARDALAPSRLSETSDRFSTPIQSVTFTGSILLVLIAFVPVVQLAKLASAFQLLVFTFEDVALIAFRESRLDSYEPAFTAPGYPWLQLFGIGGGIVILAYMGSLAIGGAVAIIIGGIIWYQVYGRERTGREGAAVDAIRRTTGEYSLDNVRTLFANGGTDDVLVALDPTTDTDRETRLLRIAGDIAGQRGGRVEAVKFEEVPDQATLSSASAERTAADETFEEQTAALADELDVSVDVAEVVAHDVERAVANYAEETGIDVILGEWQPDVFGGEVLGSDDDWYIEHAPSDLVFVRAQALDDIDEIAVVSDGGPFDPLEIFIADAIASENDATVRFVHAVAEGASDDRLTTISEYHDELATVGTVPTESELITTDETVESILSVTETADIVVMSTSAHHLLYDVLFGATPDQLAENARSTVLLTHTHQPRRHTFIRHLLDEYVF